jgi:hypothetical protein
MTAQRQFKRSEIIIAIIGLVGVLATGFLSNLDKIFPKRNIVQATYSGYHPTGNFETEFRYYFEVSGLRQTLESMQQEILQNAKNAQMTALSENPSHAYEITRSLAELDAIQKEAIKPDEIIQEAIPIYQKYFSVNEIQELNKFYSTDVMQGMVKKMPSLAHDLAPIQMKLIKDYFERLDARLSARSKPK